MDTDNVPLPILDGKNYRKWRLRMTSIFEVKGLHEVVYGDDFGLQVSRLVAADQEASDTQQAQQVVSDDFFKKNARAKMLLYNAVDDRHTTIIEPCKTAREIWERLASEYSDREPINTQALLSDYYTVKMSSAQSVSEFIANIDSLVERLHSAKQHISDEAVMAKIVSSLPVEYANFRRTWDMIPTAFKDKTTLITSLKKEEAVIKANGVGEALYARSSSRKNKSNSRSSKSKIAADKANSNCKWCGLQGHWWKECPTRPADKKPQLANKNISTKQSSNDNRNRSSASGHETAMTATFGEVSDKFLWIIDSGASEHMSGVREWLQDYKELENPRPVRIGSGEFLYAIGTGNFRTTAVNNGKQNKIKLGNVYFVPGMTCNLFSVRAASKFGIKASFSGDSVSLTHNEEIVATGSSYCDNIYKLNISYPMIANVARVERTVEEWHQVLGHAGVKQVEQMAKTGAVSGMKIVKVPPTQERCGDCQLGKATCASHPTSDRPRATEILERLHVDLVGPIKPVSLGGSSYSMTIKDEFSSYIFVRPLKSKADVGKTIATFIDTYELQTQARVKFIRSDNGSEFKNEFVKNLCDSRGIEQEFSAPRTPQQNGEAERANRTILETATTMINASSLPLETWAEAASTAAYVRNRTICTRTGGKTPFELFHSRKPDVSHLIKFGQEVFIIDHSRKESKFSPKTIEAFVVGYGQRQNTYRCLIRDNANNTIKVTSDVIPASHKQRPLPQEVDRRLVILYCDEPSPAPRGSSDDNASGPPLQSRQTITDAAPIDDLGSNSPRGEEAVYDNPPPAPPEEERDLASIPLYANLDNATSEQNSAAQTSQGRQQDAARDGSEAPTCQQHQNQETTGAETSHDGSQQTPPRQQQPSIGRATPIMLQRGNGAHVLNRQQPASYFIDFGNTPQRGGWRGATSNSSQAGQHSVARISASTGATGRPISNIDTRTVVKQKATTRNKEVAGATARLESDEPASSSLATAARPLINKISPSLPKRKPKPREMMNLSAVMLDSLPAMVRRL